ncbi:MAG: hypothetical protein U9N09_00850 [Euryarchaeota archaeon]|nr:hypothetical protein [Euryarchaeota archaeon]
MSKICLNVQIPSGVSFAGVVNSTNITVGDVMLTKNRHGVSFAYTNDSRVENVTTNSDYNGI